MPARRHRCARPSAEDRWPRSASPQDQAAAAAGRSRLAWWRRLCPSSLVLAAVTVLILWVAVAELLRQGRLETVLSATPGQLAAPLLVALVVTTGICERFAAERRPVLARGHVQDACFVAMHAVVVIPLILAQRRRGRIVIRSRDRPCLVRLSLPRCLRPGRPGARQARRPAAGMLDKRSRLLAERTAFLLLKWIS